MASFKKRFLQYVKKTTHGVLDRSRRADAAESYTESGNLNLVIPDESAGARSTAEVSTSDDKIEDRVLTTSAPLPPSPSVQERYFQTASPTPSLQHEALDVHEAPFGTTLQFESEDESDYTDGPVRLVTATDSAKPCAALLMNLDLSKKIQAAIHCEREFEGSERKTMAEQEGLIDFVAQLRIDIEERECHLNTL